MRLLTAHKILISTAAVFFSFWAVGTAELFRYGADEWAIFRGVLYLLVAVGFGLYFKNLDRLYR